MMTRLACVVTLAVLLAGCGGDAASQTASTAVTKTSFDAGDILTFKIPTMSCPINCWPKVQKAIAQQEGVSHVALMPQQQNGKINDPRVVITLDGEFDSSKAIEALAASGYKGAIVEFAN